jgi:TP53 regulating kinase and related kinases
MDTVERTLFKKGAEASLYLADWHGKKAVIKVRIPKRYRPPALDQQIRTYRTIHEAQLMHEAKAVGVPTPLIYMVDVPEASIVMEYVAGQQVKGLLNIVDEDQRNRVCMKIGESIGKLHFHGLIHGDLTTSNMIQTPEGKIYFVDFGLGEKNSELEAQGVDLHLMRRALQSTHFMFWEPCFRSVFCGYAKSVTLEVAEKVYEKICEIERRGRYVEERKQ